MFCQNLNLQLGIYELTITVSNFDLILMSISAKNQSLFYIFVLWFRSICIKIEQNQNKTESSRGRSGQNGKRKSEM